MVRLRSSNSTSCSLLESLSGTSLPSQCSSAPSGWFCLLSSCAPTPLLSTPLLDIREFNSSCCQGVSLFVDVCMPDCVCVRLFIISFFFFCSHLSVSECCATPYSLIGLTFVVSYLALGLLSLCKFYLGGYAAVQNENVMHRWGVTAQVYFACWNLSFAYSLRKTIVSLHVSLFLQNGSII